MSVEDRIALFENHIKPFGSGQKGIDFGRKYEFKVNDVPHALTYDAKKVKDHFKKRAPEARIEKTLGLYTKPPSVRPEVNDGYMKPFGGDLKGWKPQHEPKPKKEKPKKKKKKKVKEQVSEGAELTQEAVDLNLNSEAEVISEQSDLQSVAGSVTTEEDLKEDDLPSMMDLVKKGILDLVDKQNQLSATEVQKYLNEFIKCADKLQDPRDDIKQIFNKI